VPATLADQAGPGRHLHDADGLPDDTYLFGRIVRTDAQCFASGCVLIYVFSYRATEPVPPPALLVKDLLIPPATINRLGWSRGYFLNVGHRGFGDGERLPVHYFEDTLRRDRLGRRRYVDEIANRLGARRVASR
jgi:hypothetical protein